MSKLNETVAAELARSREFEKTAKWRGYTVETLRNVFDGIKPVGHWKNAFTVRASVSAAGICAAAIAYFHGRDPEISEPTDGFVTVTTEGYAG